MTNLEPVLTDDTTRRNFAKLETLYVTAETLASRATALEARATALEGPAKTAFPFAVNWGNYGGTLEDATYSRFGRLVVLQGLVTKTGTPGSGDLIGTLPAGFRPTELVDFIAPTGEPFTAGRVRVETDGDVIWLNGATGETDYTSLSGITFVTA